MTKKAFTDAALQEYMKNHPPLVGPPKPDDLDSNHETLDAH